MQFALLSSPQHPRTSSDLNSLGILVAHAEAGAAGEHACGDVHSEELLEEEFRGVGNVDLRDARFIVAGAAFVVALLDHAVLVLVSKSQRGIAG
jgi:hypothetical protein